MADHVDIDIGDEKVRVSSPYRVVFPQRGWTKLEVVQHFVGVLPGAFRAVRNRPTMLKRYLQSVEVDPIYQKRAKPGDPFDSVQIRFPSQRPGRMNVPRQPADVIRLAQLGCLDFHPWPVRATDTDHPDELRLDFDPTPGFGFTDVKQAAAGARDLLGEVGLVGWPKTSGSRGIHVYMRIEPLWDFFQTRRAVLALARELERRMEGLVTTAWWKEERKGVFVDFNQNARDKTMSAAYGVRPGGFVSTPITWDELESVEIEDFPMDRSGERWAEAGDITEGMDESAGRIDTLMEWVARDEENGIGDAPWPPHYPKMPGEPPRVQPSKQRRPDNEY